MNVHFSYKAEKTPETEREIEQQKTKIERYLQVFRPELVHLHGTIDAQKQTCSCTLNLRLPSGQFAARSDADNAPAAVKQAFAELGRELKKHKELLRSEHKWQQARANKMADASENTSGKRNARNERGAPEREESDGERAMNSEAARSNGKAERAMSDSLEASSANGDGAETGASRDVRNYINANLSRLERYIERELRFRESVGQIEPDSASKDEVLDEVIVEALSAEERPQRGSVEQWLYQLALNSIRKVARANTGDPMELHLEISMRKQNVTASDDETLQYHEPDELERREDVTPNPQQASPEEIASNAEFIDQLDLTLREADGDDREAFILHAIEGFSVEEIAQIAQRKPSEIKKSITAARDIVQRKLPPTNDFKRRLLNSSIVA